VLLKNAAYPARDGYEAFDAPALHDRQPWPHKHGWLTNELKEELLVRFPMGRVGEAEEAARLGASLLGDEAAWATG
jgi:NAD(P)-dependent dehydrogenase (short-subunit alcohol dehydrogenase family)